MLPGLRFLFAAIVLSISLLIFGLGAAALLRAAHQEFASLPSRPQPAEKLFTAQSDVAMPSLAMLRVDTPIEDAEASDVPATGNAQAEAEPDDPPSIVATMAPSPATEFDTRALSITSAPDLQNPPEASTPETLLRNEPAPEAETTSSIETEIAATESQPPPSPNPAATPLEQMDIAVASDTISTKLATLGGPVDIGKRPSPIKAKQKLRRVEVKKRLRAERATQRRKMARRAGALPRASQAPADPFGSAQPFGFPGISSRNN